jgi:predicted GNAT superfamily acetyltransferase
VLHAHLLNPIAPDWTKQVDGLRKALGTPYNPYLMPEHFEKVVLPKIGGHICAITQAGDLVGYAFLFPRAWAQTRPLYTLRYLSLPGHPVHSPRQDAQEQVVAAVASLLPGCDLCFYDPTQPQTYLAGHHPLGNLDYGTPDQGEAGQVRILQRQIWGNPPHLLYPSDMHSVEFRLATTLVARDQGEVIAFLFGFYKFGDNPTLPPEWMGRLNNRLRIESQTMGVSPYDRGRHIGSALKLFQAERARQEGIDLINWTVDPLQFPNAALNFSKLRAVAFSFNPNFYHIQNALNRVPASRFSLTWVVSSERVRQVTPGSRAYLVQMGNRPEIRRINEGLRPLCEADAAPLIGIEIPANWTQLQATDPALAQAWRAETDRIFARYVGFGPDQYIITTAGVEGDRRFLIGERAEPSLLARLIHGVPRGA